jgi:prolipoprotein diacylglyceryltransferase
MLAVLNHPKLTYDWFTTTLLRWSSDGLVIYERWVLNGSGFHEWGGGKGSVLLDFYYLCYLIAFIGVLVLFTHYRRKGWLNVKPHVPYDTLLLAMIGVLVGAKTAYIFIYNPQFYFGPPPYGPVDASDQLQRIFLNWSGMASHGAATGVLVMAFIWRMKAGRKLPIAQIGDIGAMASAFGAAWIRLANFMNAELYGRPAPDWLPWAMRFPVRSGKGNAVMSIDGQLYERMSPPSDTSKYESWLHALQKANPDGVRVFGQAVYYKNPDAYHQGYELMQRTPDGVKFLNPHDTAYLGIHEVVTTPRHPSQLYHLLLEGALLFIFLVWLRKRVKRAGIVTSAFFIGYPVARFIGEFFRQPDVQFESKGNELGTVFLGMSMGQVLSLIMMCVGIGMLIYFKKRGREIADEPIYPPDKEKKEPPEEDTSLKVPFEKGMGGSTGAGSIAGLSDLRAALAEKEKEWDREAEDELRPEPEVEQQEPGEQRNSDTNEPEQENADEPGDDDPDKLEPGD